MFNNNTYNCSVNPKTGEGGVNLVAMPKQRCNDLRQFTRESFMEPIDIPNEKFYIQDYGVTICLVDNGCISLQHLKEDNNTCAGIVVPEDAINFWKTLTP